MGCLQPSLYLGVNSDEHVPTTLLQQVYASVEVALSGNSFGYDCLPAVIGALPISLSLLTLF